MKKALTTDVADWAVEARIFLVGIVLGPALETLTRQQHRELKRLMGSANWIDTFTPRRSPWVKSTKRMEKSRRRS